MKKLRRLLFIVVGVAGGAICAGSALAAENPVLLGFTRDDFSMELEHTGGAGERYGLEVSKDLAGWTLVGESTEETPGRFLARSDEPLFSETAFFRIDSRVSGDLLDWMGDYPLAYLDGEDVSAVPEFHWAPLPAPGLVYDFELGEAMEDGSGGFVPLTPPMVHAEGLATPVFAFPGALSGMHTSGAYYWRVKGRLGALGVQGRDVFIYGPAHAGGFSNEAPAAGLAPRDGPGTGTDWGKALKAIKEIQDKKNLLVEELKNNPLAQESAFYSELTQLLKLDDATKAVLDAILSGNFEGLASDPDVVLKALCYLEKLGNFLSRPAPGKAQTNTQKALKTLADTIHPIKAALEAATDKAAQIQQTLNNLQAAIANLKALANDPVKYLADAAKAKLQRVIYAQLVKLVGLKAAGALASLLADMLALGQLLETVAKIDDLCHQLNKLLLDAINGAGSADVMTTDRLKRLTGNTMEPKSNLNCNVTISYKKLCWKQDPGTDPYKGHFLPHPVPYADGTTAKTYPLSSLKQSETADTFFWSVPDTLGPEGVNCSAGEGPCILYVEWVIQCPGKQPGAPVQVFVGVIRCP